MLQHRVQLHRYFTHIDVVSFYEVLDRCNGFDDFFNLLRIYRNIIITLHFSKAAISDTIIELLEF